MQTQFMIGLIESEVNCDLAHRVARAEQRETVAVSAFEDSYDGENEELDDKQIENIDEKLGRVRRLGNDDGNVTQVNMSTSK